MPTVPPGGSLPSDKAFWIWLANHPSERTALADVPPDVLSSLWRSAWREGGWEAMHETSQLGGVVGLMLDFLDRYREAEVEHELDAAAAETYWRRQVAG